VSRQPTIAGGLIFENEAILARASQPTITNFKHEPGRLPLKDHRICFAKMF
jgi:hypothetical protein